MVFITKATARDMLIEAGFVRSRAKNADGKDCDKFDHPTGVTTMMHDDALTVADYGDVCSVIDAATIRQVTEHCS